MRKRLMLAVVATGLLFTVVTSSGPLAPSVGAQTEIEQARAQVAAATDRLEQHLADLEETQARGDALAAQFWQVQSGVEKLDLDIAASQQITDELAVQRAGLQAEVRVIAVDQYVSRGEDIGLGDHESEADRAAAETLARIVVGTDNDALGQLAAVDADHQQARDRLIEQRRQQQDALEDVTQTQAMLVDELAALAQLQVALDVELVALEDALSALEEAEAQRQAAAAEQARIEEERRRAAAAAAAAAERARQVPTPAPTATAAPAPAPTATPEPEPTEVSNPQLPDPTPEPAATEVPNPQLPDATPEPAATDVPNPQPSQPFPTATAGPQPTAVPNPQPSTPIAPSGGGIVCPLAGPFTHTDDFNSPRAVGGVHRANDLISAHGTPVLAAAAGTVEHRDSRVGGLSAHLKGDNGDYYFYTHLSGYESVGAGHVAAGTVIGYVGMTGNAPIPHLHFEIHRGGYGNYTNPYGPVRQACF